MTLKQITEKYGLTPDGVDYALSQYQIVVSEITCGLLSKLSYDAKYVLEIAQERWCETCDLKEEYWEVSRDGYVKVEAPGLKSVDTEGFSYTPTRTLNGLLGYLCDHECFACDKTPVEARKCEWRRLIESALPHEVNAMDGEHCKYSDMVLGVETEETA